MLVELPGQFYVWLTSPEAAFLRKGMKEEILNSELLDIRLKALSFTGWNMSKLMEFSK
jgi:hypothetical protein